MLNTDQFLVELSKIFIGSKCKIKDVEVLNFYASKGFYFTCEDGRISKIGHENE